MKSSDPRPAVISPYHVTNWMPFVAMENANGVSIVCRETPMRAIWTNTIIIGGTFIGFAILIYCYADNRNWVWAAIALGLATTLGFHFGTIAFHRHQQKRGPVMVYDASAKTLSLPRSNITLQWEEVAFGAIVDGTDGSDESFAQLQIYTRDDRRFLLVSAYTIRELLPMAKTIRERVSIPVRVFIEKSHRKQLWEEQPFPVIR